ncbi:hypothetical protein PINS_up010838 [Pythium insidiosum]|nr:hypothetical protein PINS_up010838 [Pythium insidiosum]
MGAVNWPRRILTVVVAVPTALQLVRFDVGMWLLATTLCALSVVEFASNIAPRVLPPPTTPPPTPWLVTIALVICAAAATGSKTIHGTLDANMATAGVMVARTVADAFSGSLCRCLQTP